MSEKIKTLYVAPEIFDILEEVITERLSMYEDENIKERNMYFWSCPILEIIEKREEKN